MAQAVVKATRSFGEFVKDEIHTVDTEAERIASLIDRGYLDVIHFVDEHGNQVEDVANEAAAVDPSLEPEAKAVTTAVSDAEKVEGALDGDSKAGAGK